MSMRLCARALATLASAAAPALADPPQPVASEKVRPPRDPNQKICQDITQIGSRLATKRICATRAEWEAEKKTSKDVVDEIQRSPCVRDESGNCGSH